MSHIPVDRQEDPNLRGRNQHQVVNGQDQEDIVNDGPRDLAEQPNRTEETEDTLIDHSFEKEGYEPNDRPEIETPFRKEDSGADGTEKKIPSF